MSAELRKTDMVERVARALFDDEWPGEPLEEEWDHNRDAWRQKARAAIEAMREPTEGMVAAACNQRIQSRPAAEDGPGLYPVGAETAYMVMIDAALQPSVAPAAPEGANWEGV